MSLTIVFLLVLILAAIALFVSEKIPPELTALIMLSVLMLSGILSIDEGFSGFANQATITIGAMFVLSAAIKNSGVISAVALLTARIFGINFWLGIFVTMTLVAVVSAFVNNTPIVAIFIPIMLNVGQKTGISPSKLLMPVSFASIFGGTCTLIGTSTNILVSSMAVRQGVPALGMFEFAPLGLSLLGAGLFYMILAGIRMIPERACCGELVEKYSMNQYLTDIVLQPDSSLIGKRLHDPSVVSKLGIDVLDVIRNKQRLLRPLAEIFLEKGDVLRVRCDIKKIQQLQEADEVLLKSRASIQDKDFQFDQLLLVEAIIAPNSKLIGENIKSSRFRNRFQANALALRHRGQLFNLGFREMPLAAGDAILIELRRENFELLQNDENFVIVSETGSQKVPNQKSLPAFAVISGVVAVSSLGLLPIALAAVMGCILLILLRLLTIEEALAAVEWRILILLAAMIPLGTALEKTGTAVLLSQKILPLLQILGPVAVIAAIFLITSIVTSIMSNNATAVLLTPIAITMASTMGLDPKPFVMAVAFAASASFMTPIGYQTNTMIYGVGQYRFSDFMRVGAPLNLLFLIITSLLIPVFYPF